MNKLVWMLPVLVVAAVTLVLVYQMSMQDDIPLHVQLGCNPVVNHTCPTGKFSQERLDWLKVHEPKRYAVIMEYDGYRNYEVFGILDAMPHESPLKCFTCGNEYNGTNTILEIPFIAAMNPDFTSWDDCWAVAMALEEGGYSASIRWSFPDGYLIMNSPLEGKRDHDLDKYDSYSAWSST